MWNGVWMWNITIYKTFILLLCHSAGVKERKRKKAIDLSVRMSGRERESKNATAGMSLLWNRVLL